MNPIRLAQKAGRGAKQYTMYAAPAVRSREVNGPSVEVPVFPRNFRDPIPVPNPRELTFGEYDTEGDSIGSHTMKDPSRLAPPEGTPHSPERNPARMPKETYALTVAPKGGQARPGTRIDALQYQPDDSNSDMFSKASKNAGRDLARYVESWSVSDATKNIGELISGVGQKVLTPEEREKEEIAPEAFLQYFKERYGTGPRRQKTFTKHPFSVLGDGALLAVPAAVLAATRSPAAAASVASVLFGNLVNRTRSPHSKTPPQ